MIPKGKQTSPGAAHGHNSEQMKSPPLKPTLPLKPSPLLLPLPTKPSPVQLDQPKMTLASSPI